MEVVGGSGSCPAGVLEVWVEKVFEMAIGTCDKKRGDKSMILDWNLEHQDCSKELHQDLACSAPSHHVVAPWQGIRR